MADHPSLDLRQQLIAELESPQGTCRRGEGFADELDIDPEGKIRGRAVPIGKWVRLAPNLMECYEPGVFRKHEGDPARVKVCLEHGQVIGKVKHLEERADGVYFEARIVNDDRIPEAGKARAMLAEGLMDEVSVGFKMEQNPNGTDFGQRSDGITTWRHRRGTLLEISLVPWGALGREATLTRAVFDPDFDERAYERMAELESKRAAEKEWLRRFRSNMSA